MCGISGYLLRQHLERSAERIFRMTRAIAHRGPDDEGLTLFAHGQRQSINISTDHTFSAINRSFEVEVSFPHYMAFGHRRFSIIDISPDGHQPFWSRDRQVCVSFNGEIYNYIELRQQLEAKGYIFETQSDTEVLVIAYLHWGVECFQYFNGFWAISLYDDRQKAVLLARDRIGVAPLYVSQTSEGLFWSSEIKGILAGLEGSLPCINKQAVQDFVVHGRRDLFDQTFYEGITTFPSASYAWIEADGSYCPKTYWQLPSVRTNEAHCSLQEAKAQFRQILTDAVQLRSHADVPIGFTLSGGLDSSSLVALATQSLESLNVYTVAFPGTKSNEEPFANAVIQRFGKQINYQVLYPQDEDFFEQADIYVALIDEPFHSPTLLTDQGIMRRMSQDGIRVCINGAAGDETLAGYGGEYFAPYLTQLLKQGQIARFIHEIADFSEHQSPKNYLTTLYRLLPDSLQHLAKPFTHVPSDLNPFIQPNPAPRKYGPSSEIDQRLIDNMGPWLMNYWLRSGNTSFMGVPMESRMPFLDYRFVELAFTLPLSYLIRDGWLKWIMRDSLQDLLPPEVLWRKAKWAFLFHSVHGC
ncbi:MAG: asparagine synthase (glutamine-hydrolyzing) [Acaryochloridaceae cyanobacterium SU_2_1]|nr:asparagine synthase (glutamine-hydrolyzing) [Acaryochloridaceae cyanobacterium SU_2_1]